MARPKTNTRKTAISLRANLDGWIEYRGRAHGSMAAYLNGLAQADREAAREEGGEVWDRYRAYLVATGRDGELAHVEAEGRGGE